VDREEDRDLNDADKLRQSPTKTTVSSWVEHCHRQISHQADRGREK